MGDGGGCWKLTAAVPQLVGSVIQKKRWRDCSEGGIPLGLVGEEFKRNAVVLDLILLWMLDQLWEM
jgi:hypothetical protein